MPSFSITTAAARSQSALRVTSQATPMWPGPMSAAACLGRFDAQVEDGDPGSLLGKEPRRGFADSARGGGSGDDCDFVLQQHCEPLAE